jgi:hypothetical protein
VRGDVQAAGYLFVAFALGYQPQYLHFALGKHAVRDVPIRTAPG